MAGVYRPRHLERTVLYRVLFHHYEHFLGEYESRFEKEERLLMFSCRTRGCCPSCHAKRLEGWGEWVKEELLLNVPHRQVVFTIPKMLRIFFKYNRRLLGSLCPCALRSLTLYFKVLTGSELMPGVIAAIQTFGDRINLHPHLHFLITEGGVDKAGLFHKGPRIEDSRLAQIFGREVLADLVGRELLNPEWAERLLSWRHTGFNVHSRVRAKTKTEAERVGKYMIRPLLSLERLSLDEKEGKVCYRYGKEPGEVERMDYLEFIARTTSHIPDKGQVTVRYCGLYANAHRGGGCRSFLRLSDSAVEILTSPSGLNINRSYH